MCATYAVAGKIGACVQAFIVGCALSGFGVYGSMLARLGMWLLEQSEGMRERGSEDLKLAWEAQWLAMMPRYVDCGTVAGGIVMTRRKRGEADICGHWRDRR